MICEKEYYKTHKLAKDAVRALALKHKDKFRVYKCGECGNFHISTARMKKKILNVEVKKVNKDIHHWGLKKQEVVIQGGQEPPKNQKKGLPYATEKVFAYLFNIWNDKK